MYTAAALARPAPSEMICIHTERPSASSSPYQAAYATPAARSEPTVAFPYVRAVRRGDRLFRIGGDEFAALLAVSDEAEALDAATRLRNAVDEATLGVTISIGVAVPREGEPDAELLARADRALYTVKASGRDGVALAGHEPVG